MQAVQPMSEPDPSAAPQAAGSLELDRRAFVRIATDRALTCTPAERSREPGWAGRLQNISQGGFGMLLQHRFRPGTTVAVDMRDHDGAPLPTMQARVAHATATLVDGCPCWLLGCAFERPLTESAFATLRQQIEGPGGVP
jgi:hypothetical protein